MRKLLTPQVEAPVAPIGLSVWPVEERLAGGMINEVVRVGSTVRRDGGPWTPTVQALLAHVRAHGFDLAPRPLGIDEQGRDLQEYVEGEINWWPGDSEVWRIGELLRRYHDAVADFDPPGPFRFHHRQRRAGDVVAHHDLAPWNIVVRDNEIVALLDWDTTGWDPPELDLAYTVWRYASLYDDGFFHGEWLPLRAAEIDRLGRAAAICDGYGVARSARAQLPDWLLTMLAQHRQLFLDETAAGNPPFRRLVEVGALSILDDCERWISANRRALSRL